MAMNPMQRRARTSFLIGFIVALLVMAIVVGVLLTRMKTINEAKEALEAKQKMVYTAVTDLKSGQEVTLEEHFSQTTVQTEMVEDQIITDLDFEFLDKDGNVEQRVDPETGKVLKKKMIVKIDVPAKAIVTKSMLAEAGEETEKTDRIQEYNMLVLPSRMETGEYIDIRLSLPSGQDFIVLPKKKVLDSTVTGIWLQMSEEEMLTMNSAIVESYRINGSKLYAISYVEPGLQEEPIPTYPINAAVLDLINKNPNIVDAARSALWARYNTDLRTIYLDPEISKTLEGGDDMVNSGVEEEIQSIKAARQEYIDSLGGSGEEYVEE